MCGSLFVFLLHFFHNFLDYLNLFHQILRNLFSLIRTLFGH